MAISATYGYKITSFSCSNTLEKQTKKLKLRLKDSTASITCRAGVSVDACVLVYLSR